MPDDKDNRNQDFQADSNTPRTTPAPSRWKRRWNAAAPGAKGEQPQASEAQAPQPDPAAVAAPAAAPRKKSHWLRRSLLTILILLLVLAALLPTLASTDFARGIIVSQVNDRILGKVAIGNLSLSWFGNCSAAGLGVTDPQGRKVVDVAQVNWDRNLWNLLWSRENLGKLDAHVRSVDIIQTADGSTSLQEAFAMREPSPPTPEKPSNSTFSPTVDLNWTADHVRVVQPDGRQYAASDTTGEVRAKTLNDILVDLGTTLLAENGQAKGSRLTVHAVVRDLFAGGNLNLDKAAGTLSAKSDSRIAMKPILAFVAKGVNGQGDLGLDVTGNLSGGKGELKYSLDVKDLSAAGADEKTPVPPLTAKLAGGADYKDKKLHGTLAFSGSTPSGTLGEIQTEASYDTAGKTQINFAQIWDKLMKGQSVELPDFTFKVPKEAHVNLAEAIKSVPGLVPLRNGAKITGGDLQIASTNIQGGSAPSAQGGLKLLLTTAREGQPPQTWEPITVGFNVTTDGDKQVKIHKADLAVGSFVSLNGSGTPAKFHMVFNSDLSALRDRLNEVVDLDAVHLSGKLSGTLDTARLEGDDNHIGLTLNAKGEGLAFTNGSIDGKGNVNLVASGNLSSGQSKGQYTLDLTEFSVVKTGQESPVPPLNAALSGAADYQGTMLHGTLKLGGSTSGGTLGEVNSTFACDTSGKTQVDGAAIVNAVMKGNSVELPGFTLDAKGGVNVAEVAKSVPGLIQLRKGVELTGGDLKITTVHVQGGAAPAGEVALTLNLTFSNQGQEAKAWDPIVVGAMFSTDVAKRLKIDHVAADFGPSASINGSGSPTQFHLAYKADLAVLRDRLDVVLDLDKTQLGGKISGTLDTTRSSAGGDKRLDVTLRAKAEGLVAGGTQQPASAGAAPAAPTAYTGEVQGNANLEQLSNGLKLAGKLEVPDLKISSTGDVLPDDHPVLTFNLAFYTNQTGKYDRLEMKTLGLESKLLTAHLPGTIDHLTTDMFADINGDYTLSWPLATKLAKRYYPDSTQTLNFVGDTKYHLVLRGPLTNPTAMQVEAFPAVEGNTGVGWGSGSAVYGLTMGDANLAPSLANGKITLPVAKVPANGGTLGLGGLIDMSNKDDPRLIIRDHLDVMDHVGLNAQVGHDILSMALPLLANVSELDGTVSLWVEGVNLPLNGQRILKEGTGRGHLDFSSVRLRPTGPMAQLMKLTGLSSDAFYDNVKFSPVDFTLNNGALNYDNFTLTIGQKDALDLRFHGSIRFDGSLLLFVSVPVKASMLSEFGFKDPTGQIAKALDGERIDIPISGTRTNSKLDLSKVNVKPLVDQAVKKLGTGALMSNLPGLPGDKFKTPTSGPAPKGLLPGLPGDKSKTPTSGPAPKDKPANPVKIPGGLFK